MEQIQESCEQLSLWEPEVEVNEVVESIEITCIDTETDPLTGKRLAGVGRLADIIGVEAARDWFDARDARRAALREISHRRRFGTPQPQRRGQLRYR